MRRPIALVALVALVMLAACSDDSSPESSDAPSTTAPSTTTATTAPKPVPSAGCGKATEAVDNAKQTIDIAGTERWYLETVPVRAAGDDPMALVVDFHGLAEGAQIQATMSQFGALAKKEGFAVVEPNGTGSPLRWGLNEAPKDNPDLQLVTAILDRLGRELCIDQTRVYAAGLSMGAMMSSLVACVMSDRFAAIGPVAGVQFYDHCDPPRAVPVIAIHGTADPILPFAGGVDGGYLGSVLGGGGGDKAPSTTTTKPLDLNGEGYPTTVKEWAEHNRCSGSKDEDAGSEVVHRVYDCPPGAAVEFYIVKGGGHSWPGSRFSKSIDSITGHTTFDIDATELIWKFFQRFRLPASGS